MNPEASFGMTQFSDLTLEEFQNQFMGYNNRNSEGLKQAPRLFNEPAEEIDHVALGHVAPVENQGSCGSCWAFSTAGNIEGVAAVAGQELRALSKQQLMDCDKSNSGCRGGLMTKALKYVKEKGMIAQDDYPYKARVSQCQYDQHKPIVHIDDYKFITNDIRRSGDEELIKEYVFKTPVAAALDANILRSYRSGIITKGCNTNMNHAVLKVGYGVEKDVPFWNIKNSWGKSFGENGYFRLKRGADLCGISRDTSTGIIN